MFKIVYRVACIVLAVIFVVSAFVNITYSWQDYGQHKSNEFDTLAVVGFYQAELLKLEKIQNPEEWLETDTPVPGAVFELYKVEEDGTAVQVNGQYTTDLNGRIFCPGLDAGSYYFKEVGLPRGYSYDLNSANASILEYPFTIQEGAASIPAVRVFNRKGVDGFAFGKTVKNGDGSALTQSQKEQEFEFTVVFGDGGSYHYSIDGGEKLPLSSGGKLYLKHGQKVVFTGMPIGASYTVTETPQEGYSIQSDNHSGTITGDFVPQAAFVNTWPSQEKATGALSFKKEVLGEGADTGRQFDFTVSFSDNGTYSYTIDDAPPVEHTSGGQISIAHGQTVVFAGLPKGTGYTVTERNPSADGYVASAEEYTGVVIGGASIHLPFYNYKGETQEEGSFTLAKQVTGEGADLAKEFEFTLAFSQENTYTYTVNGGEPKTLGPDGKLTLKNGETALFENLPPGLGYTVTEADYTAEGYTPGIKQASGAVISDNVTGVVFVNHLQGEDITETKLVIKKEMRGNVPEGDEGKQFEFTLSYTPPGAEKVTETFLLAAKEEKSFTLPVGSYYEVSEKDYADEGYYKVSITNGHGTANGASIEIVQVNTYAFDIMVVIAGEKIWDLQNTETPMPESITVLLKNGDTVIQKATVKPDENGKWNYTFEAPKYEADGETVIAYTIEEEPVNGFIPVYSDYNIKNIAVLPVEFTPEMQKIVTGETPSAPHTFQFMLAAKGGAPMPKGSGTSKIVSVTGQGSMAFGKIVYTEAGVYTYTITEIQGAAAGYIYDQSVYTVTVTITAKDGKLVLESAVYTKEGKPAEKAVFVNTYTSITPPDPPPDEKIIIRGEKIWQHGDNHPSAYPQSITVYVRNGDKVVVVREITEADYWRWGFKLDKYDADGNEIQYTIEEKPIENYASKVTGYSITNTYSPGENTEDPNDRRGEKIDISGQKYWYHGKNAAANRPAQVVIYVKNQEEVVATKVVTAADGWKYSFSLPKYNADGSEINYTIEEERVPGYGKYIEGFNVYNSFGYKDGQRPPQTGDSINAVFWAVVMCVSGILLLLMAVIHVKNKKKKRLG